MRLRQVLWRIASIAIFGGSLANAAKVCILSDGEAEELRSGFPPSCTLHEHVSKEEAFSLTAPIFMQKDGTASTPVAKWVGPRHIQYTIVFAWMTVRESDLPGDVARKMGLEGSIRLTTKQLTGAV